jgi:hypothetical protein
MARIAAFPSEKRSRHYGNAEHKGACSQHSFQKITPAIPSLVVVFVYIFDSDHRAHAPHFELSTGNSSATSYRQS